MSAQGKLEAWADGLVRRLIGEHAAAIDERLEKADARIAAVEALVNADASKIPPKQARNTAAGAAQATGPAK
jgi:hypothetical protein